jgi:hypothetical protein
VKAEAAGGFELRLAEVHVAVDPAEPLQQHQPRLLDGVRRGGAPGIFGVRFGGLPQGFEDELGAPDAVVQIVGAEVVGEAGVGLVPFLFGARFRGKLDVQRLH